MRPLQGVRIADFTVHNAGPFCTHLLSLLGAECIKIESAVRPDAFRKPHPVYGRMEAATFDQVSSNKLSIRLNLKEPRAVELAKRLVALSDIAAESFRPGVMGRLGLGYPVLKEVNAGLVMVSISACGQTGPESGYSGYAPGFGAIGALGTLTGYEDGPPVEIRHVMDHSTGLAAAAAVLAAYLQRKRTGIGQYIDVAAREVAASFIGDALLQFALDGTSPHRLGNDMPHFAPHGVYRCRGEDSWISICVANDAEWRALAAVLGGGLAVDARFADRASRWRHRRELDRHVETWTRTRIRDEIAATLQAAGVAATASLNARDLSESSHLRERGSIRTMAEPGGRCRAVVGPPWRLSKTPAAHDRPTPALGEHETYVFGTLLGLPQAEILRLREARVIY